MLIAGAAPTSIACLHCVILGVELSLSSTGCALLRLAKCTARCPLRRPLQSLLQGNFAVALQKWLVRQCGKLAKFIGPFATVR